VEELTGRRLPPVALLDAPTVAQFASLLGDASWPPPWRSLVPLRARGSKRPLFFVPGVFGLAVSFRELVSELDEERPFYALQARGLAGDAPATRIDEMARAYVEEIRTVQPCGPYLVGGACFGARVAFEMARQLAADGDEVAKVLLVESYAPGTRGFPLPSRVARVRRRLTRLRSDTETFGPRAGLALLRLRTGRGAGKRLMRSGGDVPLVRSVAVVRRANIEAVLAYAPPPYPGGVTVVRGTHADEAPDRGWAAFAEGGVEVIEVSGSHGAVLRPPHVSALAGALERCLDHAGL
jgi:thioesterase domain-containing protein